MIAPGHSEPVAEVLFPEHVTAGAHGSDLAEHLYIYRPGTDQPKPA